MGNSRALSSSISILAMMTVERESQVVPTPTTPSPISLQTTHRHTHAVLLLLHGWVGSFDELFPAYKEETATPWLSLSRVSRVALTMSTTTATTPTGGKE
jgi:hypothetical protein